MHKKRILSLFLAVMFIASIAAPVYAGTTTTKTMIREWTVEEVSAYDNIVERFPQAKDKLMSKEEVEFLQSDTKEARNAKLLYLSNPNRTLISTYEDIRSADDIMYLDVYSDGSYVVYGAGSTSGGSYVIENGYKKYTRVKVYKNNVLGFIGTGSIYYYVDYWIFQDTGSTSIKNAYDMNAYGLYCIDEAPVWLTVWDGSESLTHNSSRAIGTADVYQAPANSSASWSYLQTITLKTTTKTNGITVTFS